MLGLIRRSEVTRGLRRWLLIAAVAAGLLMNVLVYQAESSGEMPSWSVEGVLWLCLCVYFMLAQRHRRAGGMDLALPIPAGRLWAAHVTALVIGAVATLAICVTVAVGLPASLVAIFGEGPDVAVKTTLLSAMHTVCWALLVSVLLQSRQLDHLRQERPPAIIAGEVLLIAAGGVATRLAPMLSPLTAIVPLVAAAALFGAIRRRVPPTLQALDAPDSAHTVGARSQDWIVARPAGAAGTGALVNRTIITTLSKHVLLPLLTLVLIGAFGAAMAMEAELRYIFIALMIYLLLAMIAAPLKKLYLLDILPIPRRRILALITVPSLVAFAVGYGGGFVIDESQSEPGEDLHWCCADTAGLLVPPAHFRIAWDGEPPVIISPWGEQHEARSVPLLRGLPPVIYKPFTTPSGCSIDFVALQISRAVAEIYGEELSPDEIKDRYLGYGAVGEVTVVGDTLRIAADHPEFRRREGGPVFPVVMTLITLSFFLIVSVYFAVLRTGVSQRKQKTVFWSLMALLMVFHLGGTALLITELTEDWVVIGAWDMHIRALGEALPGGTATAWLLGMLLVGAGYFVMEKQFARVEAPVERS